MTNSLYDSKFAFESELRIVIFSDRIRIHTVAGVLTIFMVILIGCAPVIEEQNAGDGTEVSDQSPAPEGMRRLYLRINGHASMDDVPFVDMASKTLEVNGKGYAPIYDKTLESWYVDVDESSFILVF